MLKNTIMNEKKTIVLAILCVSCRFLFWPPGLQAEFYKYVDENGKTVFVDDSTKIPPQHRENTQSYKQRYDDLSEKERTEKIEKEKKELEEFRNAEIAKARAYVSRETKVIIQGDQILVPVLLAYDGKEVETTLLFDTGATIVALHRDVADQLRIRDSQKGWARGASGEQITAEIARLSFVKVGPHKKENLMAGIVDFQGPPVAYHGLLGMNFLRGLKYDIDFQNQRIIWKR